MLQNIWHIVQRTWQRVPVYHRMLPGTARGNLRRVARPMPRHLYRRRRVYSFSWPVAGPVPISPQVMAKTASGNALSFHGTVQSWLYLLLRRFLN